MSPHSADILNRGIGLFLVAAATIGLRQKAVEQPLFRIGGMRIKTIVTLGYVAIGVMAVLLLLSIFYHPDPQVHYIEKTPGN